jgi:coenzyme F420-reducing hydrogenase beta subunit
MNNITGVMRVVNGGYCIGCGACKVVNPELEIKHNDYGMPTVINPEIATGIEDKVCPFFSKVDEDIIASDKFSHIDEMSFDDRIGYHLEAYAGYVKDLDYRMSSSSGGLTSWFLAELMKRSLVDAVIHVGKSDDQNGMFGYTISKSIDDVNTNKKSRYYPGSIDQVMLSIKNDVSINKVAFVGVPCLVKSVRLLCTEDHLLADKITYFVGIFCGQMKSKAFAESLGWQLGIHPDNLETIDFRVKGKTGHAGRYYIKANSDDREVSRRNSALFGTDWGLGFFKPKACDWCDDVAGEVCDIMLGDAWIEPYDKDEKGSNVVVVRNQTVNELLTDGIKSNDLTLDRISLDKVVASQAATFRHRHEGLSYRVAKYQKSGIWTPKKRERLVNGRTINDARKQIYDARLQLSEQSHKHFCDAKQRNSLTYFFWKMMPLYLKYSSLNKVVFKNGVKIVIAYFYSLIKALKR